MIILIIPLAAYADEVDVEITINKVFYLEVHPDPDSFDPLSWIGGMYTPSVGDFNAVVAAPWEAQGYGWTGLKAVDCRIWSNYDWDLWVKGDSGATFTGGDGDKPVGDILWHDGDQNPGPHALTLTDVWVGDGVMPSAPGYYAKTVSFRVLLHWLKDGPSAPGTPYRYDKVLFTLTASETPDAPG